MNRYDSYPFRRRETSGAAPQLSSQTETSRYCDFLSLLSDTPDAAAVMKGGSEYPEINGNVRFYQTDGGVLVSAELFGLPAASSACGGSAACCGRIFALHLHEGESCADGMGDPFSESMTHYNPNGCPHPYHAGDMPPVFGNDGYGFAVFFTDRFQVSDIIGKAMILHENPDDFTTQPSGNSGEKIACGIVERIQSDRRKMCGVV